VSPRQRASWPLGEKEGIGDLFLARDGRAATIVPTRIGSPPSRLARWEFEGGRQRTGTASLPQGQGKRLQTVLDVTLDKLSGAMGAGETGDLRPHFLSNFSPDGRWRVVGFDGSLPEVEKALRENSSAPQTCRVFLLDCKTGKIAQRIE